MRLIAQGNTAQIYLRDNTIVKVFDSRLPAGTGEYEAKKQRLAHAGGLPVPAVLELTAVEGRQALVMEYIPGETLGELGQANPERLGWYLERMAELHCRLHQRKAIELEPLKDRLRRRLQAASLLEAPIKTRLLEQLERLPDGDRLCHGDFHPFNVIEGPGGALFVIDWVDACQGEPSADACRSYLLCSPVPQLAESYLALYCAQSGLEKGQILNWLPVLAGARLGEMAGGEEDNRLLELIAQGL